MTITARELLAAISKLHSLDSEIVVLELGGGQVCSVEAVSVWKADEVGTYEELRLTLDGTLDEIIETRDKDY